MMVTELAFDLDVMSSQALASLGRTEDLRFSPSGHRLAIAGFLKSNILLLNVNLQPERIQLSQGLIVSSPSLNYPHGLDFLDENTLVIANRRGDLVLLPVPSLHSKLSFYEATPQAILGQAQSNYRAPGSVTVADRTNNSPSFLVCYNESHNVIRYCQHADGTTQDQVLLRKGLMIPDGLALSSDEKILAVSNHNAHSVFLYQNDGTLGPLRDPIGILKRVNYPHGLRFSLDGQHLLVADAGAPFVYIFSQVAGDWSGVHYPTGFLEVLSPESFEQGQTREDEGGPKGIDLHPDGTVFAVSSEHQPLAFFDLVQPLKAAQNKMMLDSQRPLQERAKDVAYELMVQSKAHATVFEALGDALCRRSPALLKPPLKRGISLVRKRLIRAGLMM